MEGTRRATHAGSWYSGSSNHLNSELENWLDRAEISVPMGKALIGPHAGYEYSGPTAAWAYKHIDKTEYRRVFLLGPSHHVHIPGAALPFSANYQTPLGNLPVDEEIVHELEQTGKFFGINRDIEEDEHSLELHMPYIRKAFEGCEISLVPIMVGNTSADQEKEYGKILVPYFEDPSNFFVISTDFCHWGRRFGYTPYDESKGAIHESIEFMDRQGMELIENHDPEGFRQYLARTKNTVCGRHPISVFLEIVCASSMRLSTKFVRYAQSEAVRDPRGSSVSYASSVTSINW